jgi:hypothetical protein
VEYYFAPPRKLLTYPWHRGLKVEQIEAYYDDVQWKDWTHPETQADLLKAQHPEFELWSQGTHARAGVACADCHMPYRRDGAVKISDHHVRSPLLNIARSCQVCHPVPESELLARATLIQDRTAALIDRTENVVMELIDTIRNVRASGVADSAPDGSPSSASPGAVETGFRDGGKLNGISCSSGSCSYPSRRLSIWLGKDKSWPFQARQQQLKTGNASPEK